MNWDYRYCWLRDVTFTLGALANAGFNRSRGLAGLAAARDRRIARARCGSCIGSTVRATFDEWTVERLPGYRDARPVRIGNAASTQHQIDVYGEVLDASACARRAGIAVTSQQERMVEARIVRPPREGLEHAGSGVWESRSEPRQYTYSKVMAWVGVDRVLSATASPQGSLSCRAASRALKALRQTIHDEVCREGWNAGLGTFTQSYGGQVLDASLLLHAARRLPAGRRSADRRHDRQDQRANCRKAG